MKNKVITTLLIVASSIAYTADANATIYSVHCTFGERAVNLNSDGTQDLWDARVTNLDSTTNEENCNLSEESKWSKGPVRFRVKFNDHCELRLPPNWMIIAKLFPGLSTTIKGRFILNGVISKSTCSVTEWQECH